MPRRQVEMSSEACSVKVAICVSRPDPSFFFDLKTELSVTVSGRVLFWPFLSENARRDTGLGVPGMALGSASTTQAPTTFAT